MKRYLTLLMMAAGLMCVAARPAWAQPAPSANTFILSNEGGGLISKLLSGGYGNLDLYDALLTIVQNTNPSVS